MNPNKAISEREMQELFRDLEEITTDLSSYFDYCQKRQLVIHDWMAGANLN
jgi:hypothetical protein